MFLHLFSFRRVVVGALACGLGLVLLNAVVYGYVVEGEFSTARCLLSLVTIGMVGGFFGLTSPERRTASAIGR